MWGQEAGGIGITGAGVGHAGTGEEGKQLAWKVMGGQAARAEVRQLDSSAAYPTTIRCSGGGTGGGVNEFKMTLQNVDCRQ